MSHQSSHRPTYVGIDIGKQNLDAAAPGWHLTVSNDRQGWNKLLVEAGKLKRHLHFVCEPSGYVGAAFIAFLFSRRKRLSLIPPFRARQFAKATGRMAKTDKIDAAMLADLGEKLRPPATTKPREPEAKLQAVVRCRRQLLSVMKSQQRYLQTATDRALRECIKPVIHVIGEQLGILDQRADKVIAGDACLRRKYEAFLGVIGMGPLTTKYVLSDLPEIGQLNRGQAAALAGLAPINRDSGKVTGERHIWGGRVELRASLYMAALVAATHNPILAPFYTRLRNKGKPHYVAIVAVMRKLLVHLNSLAAAVEKQNKVPVRMRRPEQPKLNPQDLACSRTTPNVRGEPASLQNTLARVPRPKSRASSPRCSAQRLS